MLFYVPRPVCRIQGVFESGTVLSGQPNVFWQRIRELAGMTKAAYDGLTFTALRGLTQSESSRSIACPIYPYRSIRHNASSG